MTSESGAQDQGRAPAVVGASGLMFMLAAVLAEQGVTATSPDAFVFVSSDGSRLHYSNWRRRVLFPAREAAGLPCSTSTT